MEGLRDLVEVDHVDARQRCVRFVRAVDVGADPVGVDLLLKKTDLKPSASPEVDGPPRFIWLPRMLGRP
jgi:hypothetical protein